MAKSSWKPLTAGEQVDVIAPGFLCSPAELENGVQFLKGWGLSPRVPKDIFKSHFLHSSDDETRWKHLREALTNNESTLIWCVRGGYGANRLLPYLAKMPRPKKKKMLVGLSDVTSLHYFLNSKWRWPTLHASLLDRLGKGQVPRRDLMDLKGFLFGTKEELVHHGLAPLNKSARNILQISSLLVGGNLTVLQSTLGTGFSLKANRRILFLEDIGERGYRVDRMLHHLKSARALEDCEGVIFGDFTGGAEAHSKSLVPKVIERFAQEVAIPVFGGLRAGHGTRQAVLPLGTRAWIQRESERKFSLKFEGFK